MGHLIPTEIEDQGHQISFEYIGNDTDHNCFAVCLCGWRTEIDSFRNPWSVTEVKVKVTKHFEEMGIQPRNAAAHAIYSFNEIGEDD